MKKLIDYLIQHLVIALPTKAWIFIFMLALTPITVGIIEGVLSTDWPDKNPFVGDLVQNYQPQREVIIQSIRSAILLGFSGWFILFISTFRRFQQFPKLIRAVILGISILFLVGLLWFELEVISVAKILAGPTPPMMMGWYSPGYVIIINIIWTIGTIFFMLSYFKGQSTQLQ